MASRKTVSSPRHCRRSLDQGAPAVIPAFPLRQEQSSPAVVQQTDFSLARAIVSASGQGAGALLKGPSSSNAVWRTRSVRNKTESYCILQLKQPARGITVQITFTSAATTPREIRLLHALAVNGTFKPLAAQHCLNAAASQQVQHSLAVSPSIQVQHYLKVEMQGQAVAATTGACHAVCQLDVIQLSALATAAAAQATPLPVPAFESPAPTTVTDISADVLLASPTEEGVQDITSKVGAQQLPIAAAQQQPPVQQQSKTALAVRGDKQRFNSWLDQTRSSLQHSRRNSGNLSRAAAPASDHLCLQAGQPEQLPPVHQPVTQVRAPTDGEHMAVAATAVYNQRDQQQPQQQQHAEQQPSIDLQVTLEANRQQLLQLQKQYQLLSKTPQLPQEPVGGHMQPHTVQRQLLLGLPRSQAPVHATAAVLTAAGRPSTVLSMLKCSDSWSDEQNGDNSSSTLSASMDTAFRVETCTTPEVPVVEAVQAVQAVQAVEAADGTQIEPPAAVCKQQWQQASKQQDESAVLMGSLVYEPGFSCDIHMSPAPPALAAESTVADRCNSSCSIVGPGGGQDHYVDDLLDEASSLCGDSIVNPMFDDMRASIMQLAVAGQAADSSKSGLDSPVLVDSQSCLPAGSCRPPRLGGQADGSPAADRKVQSCPAISPRLASSAAPSNNEPAAGHLRTGCRPHTTGSSHQQALRSPCGAASLFGAAAGVILSPEVMRRGQLVKQSCPTFSFPRYDSHSPARLSKEYVPSTAAAQAALGGEGIDEDQEPADSIPRRSRLAQASSSRDWRQQPVRELFADAEEHAVENIEGPMQATAHNASIMFSPVFQLQQLPTRSEATTQQPSEQGRHTLLGTVPPQQVPIQQNNHKLLQALLFSSCDYGSSMDLDQAAAQQQGLPKVPQPEHGGHDSPNKLHHQLCWDQQHDQQQQATCDAQGSPLAPVATSVPQLTQAVSAIFLSPIAESPEVSKPVAGSGTPLGAPSAGSEIKAKSCLAVAAAAAACDHQHDLEQTDQQKQQQVLESLQQLLALTRKSAEAQPVYQLQQHQQVLQEQPQSERHKSEQESQQLLPETLQSNQQLQQPPSPPPPQDFNSAQCDSQQHVSSTDVSRHSDQHVDSSDQSSVCVGSQSSSVAADAAVVAGHFSRAAGRSGGPAGYHRMRNYKQQRQSSSTGSLNRTTPAAAAVATAGASGASGSRTARSADLLLRHSTQHQHQQHNGGSLRASAANACSQISRPATRVATAAATAGSKADSKSTGAGTSRRHSAGNPTARSAQAASVRTSHLKLDLLQAAGLSELSSSMVGIGSGGSKTTAAGSAGSAASGKARGAAKYEQLLQSHFGKPRSSQPGSNASKQVRPLATQMQASGTGPVTTSLCLADLFATNSGQSAQHQGSSAAPPSTAIAAASNRSDNWDVVEQMQLCPGDMVPTVEPALQQAAGDATSRNVHRPSKPYQLQRSSSRQWHENQVQPAQLPFAQRVDISEAGCIQPPEIQHLQQPMSAGWQQQQQIVARRGYCEPAAGSGAGTSPASPNQQLNLFLPKLVQPQLLTPQTLEQPGRHGDSARQRIENSRISSDVHRGPSPSTPSWLGMASPKSGAKQQQVHDRTRQQESMQQDCQPGAGQVAEQQEPLQMEQQRLGHLSKHLQAAESEDLLVKSIDAAIKAASASLGARSPPSSISSAGSVVQQHSSGQKQLAAEAEVSSPPATAPAPAGGVHPDVGGVAAAVCTLSAAHALQQKAQSDAAQGDAAQVPLAVAGTACSSPTRTLCRPSARSCPLIASPIRASQVARKGPAVIGSFQLQTVRLDTVEPACSGSSAVVAVPAEPAATLARSLTGASSNPARSTIIVSIVKHAGSGRQQQVQLQQRYVFEAQPIHDVVQLDTPAGIDSCASCSSSMAPAGDGFDSVEAQLYHSQYEAAATSPAGTEVSMVVHRPAAVNVNLAAAAAAAHEEEVASSDEPVEGQSRAEAHVGSGAAACATSPGSCGSAISSNSDQRQGRGAPGHLIRQAVGQPKSRLGLHQLAAANSIAAAGAVGKDAASASSGGSQHSQQQHSIVASRGPAAEQQTAGVAATTAGSEAIGQRAGSSLDSFCTASSQMGTVWPHEHCHTTVCGALAASDPSASSGSSVSDTGLQHPGLPGDNHCQVSKHVQQHGAAAHSEDEQDAVCGVQLARSFYHRSSQHSGQSLAAASSKPISRSHGDVAVSQSLSGTHSCWDETDPVADDATAAGAGGTPAMAQAHSSLTASELQLLQMPHRVRDNTTYSRPSKEKCVQQIGPARCSADAAAVEQYGGAGGGGRELRGSIHCSTHDSVLSDVSVVSDADSATSAAGPPQRQATGAASAAEDESKGSAADRTHLQQQQHERLQFQQQQDAADRDSTAEQVASTSLSFAAMHTPHSGYSSHHSTPGMSSTAAASVAPKQHPTAEAAVADSPPMCPAARPAARHEPLAASLEGSVGSSGFQPMQADPSASDVAVGDSQQAAGSKKDQSPNKASISDQPDKLQTSKPAASPGVVTSHVTGRLTAAVASAAASDQYADAEGVVSINRKGSCQRVAAAAAHKPAGVEQQQQQQQSSPYSLMQQHQVSPQLLTQSESATRPRLPPQLQVVVPGSPKTTRTMASTAVCFSPLHAARASRGSVGSLGASISSPGRQTAPVPPFAHIPAAVVPAVVQPALSGDSTSAPAATQAAVGSSIAAAAAAPVSESTKQQPVSAGAVSPYSGFSPLHSMLPGSGSDGRISSKTHSRTKKGSPGQEDEVTMVRKNLMDDMIRAAAGGEVPAILGYAVVAEKSGQLPDTHGVRDSKLGTPAAAGRIMGIEQPGTILHTPLRPHKGSVLDRVALQLPAVGVSPLGVSALQQQQQVTGSGDSSSLSSAQQLQETPTELSQAQLEQHPEPGLVAEGSLMQQWSSEVLMPQVSSRGTVSESGLSDSLHLMSQSSAAAAAAMRAAAATPAPIPSHRCPVDGEVVHEHADQPRLPDPQQQQHDLGARASAHDKGSSAGSSLAVVSVDGAIPPVSAATTPQKSILSQPQPGAAGSSTSSTTIKQQHTCGIKPAAAAPNSGGKVTDGTAGPLSSYLRRHNSAGAVTRVQAASAPASAVAGLVGLEDSTQAACSPANAGAAGVVSQGPAEAIGQSPVVSEVLPTADRGRQQQHLAPTATGPRAAGSPYLQQLQEHSAQALQLQQLRGVTASPLSTHRHQLSFRMQQLVNPRSQLPDAAGAVTVTVPSSAQVRPASSLGHHSPVTPSRPSCSSSQQTGDVYVSAGTAASAADANAGQVAAGNTRGSSCSGRISPVADGANSGAARMGRLRHRRARSDMPEYYPLSPLESPLHTAMPEDMLNMCEITLSPQVSAAAAAALAAAETLEAGARVAGGPGNLLVVQTATEPAAGPLGSPLRHGLLSPAAMYRIQQQQLKEQASQQQLGPEQSTAAVASPSLSPAVSREPSKADVQQKQQGVAQAVANAVAAYEGSISPRRLAKIQEYVSGLVSADVGGSILEQGTPQHKAVADVRAASTPGKDSDAFDSFNLNNQLNLQAELEQHGQQLELQQQQQQSDDCNDQPVQQLDKLQLVQGGSVSQQQQLQADEPAQQLQDQLTPRQELTGILTARLSKCSVSTVRASVEALLAAKMRSSMSSTRSHCSSRHESVAVAAAGEGECATAVAQLLQSSAEPVLPLVQSEITELPFQHSGRLNSSRSYAGSVAASEHCERHFHHQHQPPLTAARLRQHSLDIGDSHHNSNQRYPLHGEPSYASSAAASHAELLQAAAMAAAAGDKSLLTSIQELLEAPALLSASTETSDLRAAQQAGTDQLSWQCAVAQYAGSRQSLGHRQSQDSQQEAVLQSHGALLGPGLTEPSTAACGAVAGNRRPASSAPKAAAAPAGHALAGGMFRRSAQLLAGLANGLLQPTDVGSVESTAGSMAVGSSALGSRATGAMRQPHGFDRVADDEEFSKQLRASVNMVAGSLDISGPQVVRLTQQLWLNRLLPESVPEGDSSQPTPATAGSTFRSTTTGSGSDYAAASHQRQQQVGLGPLQPARGVPGGAPQAQMGPLLAGRLAAMAAMRQLRRSSVGESPGVVGNGFNLAASRRSLASLAGPTGQASYHGSIAGSEGLKIQSMAEEGLAGSVRSSGGVELHAAAPAIGGGIGRGRLSAAEATVPGALTSSNSFGSGSMPGNNQELQQCHQPQALLIRQLSTRQGQQQADRGNAMRASVASLISDKDGFYDQEHSAENNADSHVDTDAADWQHMKAAAGISGSNIQSSHGQASDVVQQLLWGATSDSR